LNSISGEQEQKSNTFMYIIWFSIVFLVLSSGYAYIGWRLIAPAKLGSPWNILAWTGLAILFVLPLVSTVLMRYFEKMTDPFSWIAYVGLGFISFLITLLLARDLIWLAWTGLAKGYTLVHHFLSATSIKTPEDPARRDFLLQLSNLAVVGISAALTTYGIYEARRKPETVRITVPINGLDPGLHGFRIVQITDIHAGLTVRRDWIETIVAEVRNLSPDLIAFTGDMADGTVPHLSADVAPFGELQATYGKYFITGNHEYFTDVISWLEEIKRLGFDVLINEHRVVKHNGSSFVLAGVTDPIAEHFLPEHKSDPEASIRNAPATGLKILLAHQPNALYRASKLGFNLVISGHTHGGQFFPWNFAAALGQPYISGLHHYNGTWIYVSKGTGYWGPPVRVGARSEITVITLEQGINQKT
jgi:predicted MPP superfamily phosphohydrolase